jgi:putative ABC transport system ATP-binding protein
MSPPLLAAKGLGRSHPRSAEWLFRGVTLQVSRGDRLALVGPTGSGKSLVLRALALLDPVDEGEVSWNGQPVADTHVPEFRSQVIYLQQRSPVVEGTVAGNLRIPYTLRVRQDLAFPDDQAVELLAALGKGKDFLDSQTATLSGGERQIVALLRALLATPTVLLLDEPSAALDPSATSALESLVEAWHDVAPTERAYIWVSHDPTQAQRVGKRVLRLEAGRLETDG